MFRRMYVCVYAYICAEAGVIETCKHENVTDQVFFNRCIYEYVDARIVFVHRFMYARICGEDGYKKKCPWIYVYTITFICVSVELDVQRGIHAGTYTRSHTTHTHIHPHTRFVCVRTRARFHWCLHAFQQPTQHPYKRTQQI